MTINNTRHIVMDEDDIKTAIIDFLFRTNQIEAEHDNVKIYHYNGGGINEPETTAKIDIPINDMEDLHNG